MGIKEWVSHWLKIGQAKSQPTPTKAAETPPADTGEQMSQEEAVGLNFKAAIEAHQNWKKRLLSVVDGSSTETLQVEVVSRDDQCLLGKWIHGIGGENFSNLDEFAKLKANHAHFHVCAGRVLTLAQANGKKQAFKELNDGEYAQASLQVIRDLVSVHIHAAKKEP